MKRLLLLIAVLLAPCVVSPARADATSAARQAIQATYNKMLVAVRHRDATAFLAYLTPDFKAIGPDGKAQSKAQLAKVLKQAATEKEPMPPPMTVRIRQITLRGKEATVLQEQLAGPAGIGRLSRDVWVSTAKGWRIRQTRAQARK